jgi:hypothetical protein
MRSKQHNNVTLAPSQGDSLLMLAFQYGRIFKADALVGVGSELLVRHSLKKVLVDRFCAQSHQQVTLRS